MMKPADIRALESRDYNSWLPLWTANNMGIRNDEVTQTTWARLCDPASQVKGFGAWRGKEMAGLVHYILHPVTGHTRPVCYMQDLFVQDVHRKNGIARALVQHLAAAGKTQKWARLYWLAERNNEAAQALYKSLGVKLDFTLHVLML